jgi:endonuclease-8
MDDRWDEGLSLARARERAGDLICDTLLDQEVLAGPGNVIKNEALFSARVHPASPSECIPADVLLRLLGAVRDFSFTWYRCDREEKRINPFLNIYRKKACPECSGKVESGRIGALERISFWCPACQVQYLCRSGKRRKRLRHKTEIKNLNSFNTMELAIEAEILRQIAIYTAHPHEEFSKLITPGTYRFDQEKNKRFL